MFQLAAHLKTGRQLQKIWPHRRKDCIKKSWVLIVRDRTELRQLGLYQWGLCFSWIEIMFSNRKSAFNSSFPQQDRIGCPSFESVHLFVFAADRHPNLTTQNKPEGTFPIVSIFIVHPSLPREGIHTLSHLKRPFSDFISHNQTKISLISSAD